MPKLPDASVPKYRHHKPSGQAVVTLNGRDVYLGEHGSSESKEKYRRLTGEWQAAGRQFSSGRTDEGASVGGVVLAYRKHADCYYRDSAGDPTGEADRLVRELSPLVKLYRTLPAKDFTPLKLKAVRDRMIDLGWVRTSINHAIGSVRRMFKWAAENELVPGGVPHALQCVAGLRIGRSAAEESDPVRPVPIEVVRATIRFVSKQVATMIELQSITGMRPGEVVMMRGIDIDTTGKLWIYRPAKHKTAHHGHAREVYLGPRAQTIIGPMLKPDLQAFIFDPQDAELQRRRDRHARRRTPLSCGNRPGQRLKRRRARQPGQRYTVASYRRAITRASDHADELAKGGVVIGNDERIIPQWHPHQLRHSAATELRKNFGIEAAQVMLGHRSLTVTQLYAEKNVQAAMRIAAEVG